ncbi:MAG: Rrf2 family transcriptional regulator [Chitinophagales bacterium]|nr:Rrf2 family transcriptional regulator [Chitinophagales bacterium]MCB9019862.1 Rrf2 family transcriptional regulator [Chitinophagales bacterium]MCB9020629.1 Rrf2 family transcriptional regulator [Chitinophagales bacterium]HPE98928.1 Rrf2 family transcriptional regulator [Chitinophagales bacterium]HPR28169.1 Rrf2 family transcriptional regulator [Chitinophagales bacterium]
MLSTKCKYAIRSVLLLAAESSLEQKWTIKQISDHLSIPQHFLGKILQELVPRNIISSMKGPTGGFYMNEQNRSTTLLTLIEVVDGPFFLQGCGLGLEKCSDTNPCPIHDTYKICRNHLRETFSSKKISEFEHDILSKNLFLHGSIK